MLKRIEMRNLQVFTDGSVNTQLKIGYGAYLVVNEQNLSFDALKETIKIKRFEQTSSTKLELQTLLWALNEIIGLTDLNEISLTIYTDSQNLISLPGRRLRLEQNDYFSRNNKRLKNYELYQQFYQLTGELNCTLVKVVGHQVSSKKNQIDRQFGLVDQAARKALREEF